MKNIHKKTNWRLILLWATNVILSLSLVLLLCVAVGADMLLGRIHRDDGQQPTLSEQEIEELLRPDETRGEDYTGPVYNSGEIEMPSDAELIASGENIVNILLIGQDRRGNAGRSLSDAMILCTINKQEKTLTMTSFLRDTYVKIPGRRDNKLNATYILGGMELLDAALEVNFGVQVDGNVEVDFSQFAKLVDYLGGVDIDLTLSEANHLNYKYGFALKQGVNHLNGEQALAYSRIRKLDSDFGRTNRQRTVLTALLNQFRNASAMQLTSTVTGMLDMITTDMSDKEIMSYALELAPLLKDLKINSQSIPVEGSYSFGDVADSNIVDCIFINFEKNRQLLAESIGG